MSLPSLYTLTKDFESLMELEEPDEIDNALTVIVAGQIEQKAENVCKFIKMLDTTAELFKAEEERIRGARKVMENKAERIRDYMKQALLNANIDKVNAGTFKVSVGLSPGSIAIDDLASIPPRFLTVIPEQYQPDKTAIKTAIKAGESVPGAHLEAGFMLRIR